MFGHNNLLNLVGSIFWLLFIPFFTLSQLRGVLKQREVTGETICMAISLYLLPGFAWTLLYGTMFQLHALPLVVVARFVILQPLAAGEHPPAEV
jgi:hypothetical protein